MNGDNSMKTQLKNISIFFCLLFISKATLATESAFDYAITNEAVETYRGEFKIGNPYKINGKKYRPRVNNHYNEVGIASWYGDDFHEKLTANGEIYNQFDYTAAHPTLPLPSIAEVTNLVNGKKIIVRINDRGPFAKDRIIDLSFQSAFELGFIETGTTKVRVKFLKKETDMLHQELFGKHLL